MAIVVSSFFFKQEKLTTKKVIGCIVGFLGVVLVNMTGQGSGEGSFLTGDLLIFLSTVAYAFSSWIRVCGCVFALGNSDEI